eukprot:1190527-Prorocentrum_minimum.AAC.6
MACGQRNNECIRGGRGRRKASQRSPGGHSGRDISPDLGDISPDLGDIRPDLGDISPDLGDISPDLGDISPDLGDIALERKRPAQNAKTGE